MRSIFIFNVGEFLNNLLMACHYVQHGGKVQKRTSDKFHTTKLSDIDFHFSMSLETLYMVKSRRDSYFKSLQIYQTK